MATSDAAIFFKNGEKGRACNYGEPTLDDVTASAIIKYRRAPMGTTHDGNEKEKKFIIHFYLKKWRDLMKAADGGCHEAVN